MFGWLFPKPKPKVFMTGPNGEKREQTSRHLTGVAADGLPHCDRCKDGDLLACMDPCRCGRMG
jgi:hypothetical protein